MARAIAEGVKDVLNADVDREAMAERNNNRFSWERSAAIALKLMNH